MKHLIIAAIFLLGWIIFWIISHRSFFLNKTSAQPINTTIQFGNSPRSSIRQNLGIGLDSLQLQIQSELYNSISTGMSYEEVSSIIGWKGVLLYEYEYNNGLETIYTKVYQWNSGDLNSLNNISARGGVLNPYASITLEFQNDLLVDRPFPGLKP